MTDEKAFDSKKLEEISSLVEQNVNQILREHPQKEGSIFVIGCSSSEIGGGVLGHNSNAQIGKAVFEGASKACKANKVFLAAQCCEHLNRALVIDSECAEKYNLEQVCVVPWLKGGGSFATAAFYANPTACVVEHVKASAGMDIGGTLIGMHLKDVAVPFRPENRKIGEAAVTAAFCRPKLIGGERARYTKETIC